MTQAGRLPGQSCERMCRKLCVWIDEYIDFNVPSFCSPTGSSMISLKGCHLLKAAIGIVKLLIVRR